MENQTTPGWIGITIYTTNNMATKRKWKVSLPTEEECQWVTDNLIERNPNLFVNIKKNNHVEDTDENQEHLTPAQLVQAVIGVYIGSHGT